MPFLLPPATVLCLPFLVTTTAFHKDDSTANRALGSDYKISRDCVTHNIDPLVYICGDFCGPGYSWNVGVPSPYLGYDQRCFLGGCEVETACGELLGWTGNESSADVCQFYCPRYPELPTYGDGGDSVEFSRANRATAVAIRCLIGATVFVILS